MEFNENASDDEVFFGKLTLKEVKKRIFMGIHEKNKPTSSNGSNIDFELIKVNSQPNMLLSTAIDRDSSPAHLKSSSDPLFNRNNKEELKLEPVQAVEHLDSFLEIEKHVLEQEKSLNESENNLNNTLEVVNYILNHAPNNKNNNVQLTSGNKLSVRDDNVLKKENLSQSAHDEEKLCQEYVSKSSSSFAFTPSSDPTVKSEQKEHKAFVTSEIKQYIDDDGNYFDCDVKVPKDEILSQSHDEGKLCKEYLAKSLITSTFTPALNTTDHCEQTDHKALRTPNNIKCQIASTLNTPMSNKRVQNSHKVPHSKSCRSKAYEHIASPIATYIKNSPQVPLVRDVHPKKPLPSSSLIPKLVKNAPDSKIINKENIVLPQLAYRSAKKTTVIDVNKEKLPQSNWAQKLPTSLQKPVVLKHSHREIGRKPLVSQQDSFNDLSLNQADVSICTQKLAFKKL